MMKFIREVLMRQRTGFNVIRKTDDELTRYLKQKRLTTRRRDFEEAMSLEKLTRENKMNTREIRMDHYVDMQNLDKSYYDKGYINDNVMDYEYLHNSSHYKPLGQKYRPFYLMPMYGSRKDWEYRAGWMRYVVRMIVGLLCIGVGYQVGTWDSKDELIAERAVVEFESEEQIYDILFNQKKLAVFVYFYTPGQTLFDNFNSVFDQESSKYQLAYRKKQDPECEEDAQDDIVFMRVHCRKHLNFCVNKMWPGRMQPAAELYSLDEKDEMVEVVDFANWHRSAQGIEGFFTKHGLIDDRFNPEELLERGGRKFIQII